MGEADQLVLVSDASEHHMLYMGNVYKYVIIYVCIVLYCIVLYCIVLYCIVLYCIVLYCIVLYCIVLYCIVLYYYVMLWNLCMCTWWNTSTPTTRASLPGVKLACLAYTDDQSGWPKVLEGLIWQVFMGGSPKWIYSYFMENGKYN